LLNESVVLVRQADAAPADLTYRHCHHAAPLSRGRCIGDYLEYSHHGLQFDANRTCATITGQSVILPDAKLRSYTDHETQKTA